MCFQPSFAWGNDTLNYLERRYVAFCNWHDFFLYLIIFISKNKGHVVWGEICHLNAHMYALLRLARRGSASIKWRAPALPHRGQFVPEFINQWHSGFFHIYQRSKLAMTIIMNFSEMCTDLNSSYRLDKWVTWIENSYTGYISSPVAYAKLNKAEEHRFWSQAAWVQIYATC